MTKKEFLKKIEESLSSYLTADKVIEQVNYYDDYITNEIKNGKSELDVLNELGDPTLIAKTIKQVNNTSNDNPNFNQDNLDNNYQENNESTSSRKRYTRMYDATGLGCSLASIFILIIFIFILKMMGFLVSGMFFFISPFSLVVLIMLIISLFKNRR